MATLVGTQTDFADAIKQLIELDYDAAEAYATAYNKLNNDIHKIKIREFQRDHEQHAAQLTELLENHNVSAPSGPSVGKQWLTKGKVIIAGLMGNTEVLKAMLDNEVDTNTAYERMLRHENMWSDAISIIRRGLEDEKKHKSWLESVTNNA